MSRDRKRAKGRSHPAGFKSRCAHHVALAALFSMLLCQPVSEVFADSAIVLPKGVWRIDTKFQNYFNITKRYDPDDFQASPCIGAPNRESAQVWYEDAARAGDTAAQRRLGQLLVEQAASGIIYEEGRDWLRKAAAAGDGAARQTLDRLEQR